VGEITQGHMNRTSSDCSDDDHGHSAMEDGDVMVMMVVGGMVWKVVKMG
jgi:hypothetical protein